MDALSGDKDRSLDCKRARHDLGSSNPKNLSQNESILHSVYDSGVNHLESNSKFDLDVDLKHKTINYKPTETANKGEQIAVLEASRPEDVLHKVPLDELKRDNQPNNSYEEPNYFNFLSDEVILYVFSNLPITQLIKVAQVCKRFHQICEDESLWTRIDLSNETLESGSIGIILSHQVINLKLKRCRILSPPILPNAKAALSDFQCRLKYLDLTSASVAPQTLLEILIKCKRLTNLSLENLSINDSLLNAISLNRDIEVLNLEGCTGMTVKGFKDLLTNCKKIRELNLSCPWFDTECVNFPVDFIFANLPSTLRSFKFSDCHYPLDQNVNRLVANCPHLRELDLTDCDLITGNAVNKITELGELTHLCLSRSRLLTSGTLLYLTKMESLVCLNVCSSRRHIDKLQKIKEAFDEVGITMNLDLKDFF